PPLRGGLRRCSWGCTPGYFIPPLRGGSRLRFFYLGLHPRLFHPTPSGWVASPLLLPGVAPQAISSHPFGVGCVVASLFLGLHPRLFHPTPSGWVALPRSCSWGCTPGYFIPPLRGDAPRLFRFTPSGDAPGRLRPHGCPDQQRKNDRKGAQTHIKRDRQRPR